MPRLPCLALSAACVGTVAVLFAAPLIVRLDYARLSPGDQVDTLYGGFGVVESVDDERGVAQVRSEYTGQVSEVPVVEITER